MTTVATKERGVLFNGPMVPPVSRDEITFSSGDLRKIERAAYEDGLSKGRQRREYAAVFAFLAAGGVMLLIQLIASL